MDKIKKYIPYTVLLIASMLLLVRAFYSFCWSDETFYSSTAYRFMCGDRLFFDDWFPTQLSSVIILPFIYVFRLLSGSMDGVIAYLRVLYVIASFATSSTLYYVFSKDKNKVVAYVVSLMMLFYTHLNIATLSYYTMSVQCFLLAAVLIYHFTINGTKTNLVIAGVLFALSVLCLPTMTLAYVLVVAGIVVLRIVGAKKKNQELKNKLDRIQIDTIALYSFVGILIPAILFFVFMLLNVSITDFVKGIPYVLSDEEHGTSLIFPLRKFYISINREFHKGAYMSYLLICASVIVRKKLMKPMLRYMTFCASAFVFAVNALYALGHTGYIQTALCLFALPLYILTNKRDKKLFGLVFVGGMIFSLVFSYSSNGFLYVLSMGHAIASVAAVVFIYDFVYEVIPEAKPKENVGEDAGNNAADDIANGKGSSLSEIMPKIIKGVSVAIVCYCLCTTAYLRFVNVYRDAPLKDMTVTILQGPAKGLKTTEKHRDMYDKVYETVINNCTKSALNIGAKEDGYIFITRLLPFGYMCTDLRVAAPTTWRTNFDSERLREFYELHPEKVPDVVLLLDEEYGTYDTCGDVEYDPNPNANEIGGFLEEYLNENDYTCEKVACGLIYKKQVK